LLFKFVQYEKFVLLCFEDSEYLKFPLCKIALDSISYLANDIYQKYDCYYLRLRTIPYASFKSFRERENALIAEVNFIESGDNRDRLLNSIENFIEKYSSEPEYFWSLTNIKQENIKTFLIIFYQRFLLRNYSFRKFLEYNTEIKYESFDRIKPQFEKYPAFYRKVLEKEFQTTKAMR